MATDRTNPTFYETLARYAPGEGWVAVDVSASRTIALEEAFLVRDPWGREPIELRVRAVSSLHGLDC
jgi:hypothetical protein